MLSPTQTDKAGARTHKVMVSVLPQDDGRLVWPEEDGHPCRDKCVCGASAREQIEAGDAAATVEHPLETGDIVDVRNSTLGGESIIEGRATIASPVKSREHTYNVRFHDDGHRMTYQRFVLPEHLLIEGKTI